MRAPCRLEPSFHAICAWSAPASRNSDRRTAARIGAFDHFARGRRLSPRTGHAGLFRGENRGARYFWLDACRFRLFGGSTNRWGGWCRPLEPVDYEQRDWLPWSGWPIDNEALKPYQTETARLFELTDDRFDLASWRGPLTGAVSAAKHELREHLFPIQPRNEFRRKIPRPDRQHKYHHDADPCQSHRART
jgi:choline dehydrogenase-like flavoprotein